MWESIYIFLFQRQEWQFSFLPQGILSIYFFLLLVSATISETYLQYFDQWIRFVAPICWSKCTKPLWGKQANQTLSTLTVCIFYLNSGLNISPESEIQKWRKGQYNRPEILSWTRCPCIHFRCLGWSTLPLLCVQHCLGHPGTYFLTQARLHSATCNFLSLTKYV